MLKRICAAVIISAVLLTTSGCAVIGAAISAGVAYGIYQLTNNK